MLIKNKVFLITGAGSGLGSSVATLVIEKGGRAVLFDLDEANGAAKAAELGEKAVFCCGDVTSESDGQRAVETATKVFGGLDALINCAGIAPGRKILGSDGPHPLTTFIQAVSVNLIGTFNMLRLAAEAIAAREPGEDGERGVIVNTASIAAQDGQIGQAAYAASKGGISSLTLPAARELARHGIRVATVAPGVFSSPMVEGLPKPVQDSLGAAVPFPRRLGKPAEYAALVGHIIENRMINGEVIRIDGALRLEPK